MFLTFASNATNSSGIVQSAHLSSYQPITPASYSGGSSSNDNTDSSNDNTDSSNDNGAPPPPPPPPPPPKSVEDDETEAINYSDDPLLVALIMTMTM